MREQEPSRTAFAAAAHRAAHQLLEDGMAFRDPLAVRILMTDPAVIAEEARNDPTRRGMRFFIALRARLAELLLEEAVTDRGVGQLVVLGAGLDTFGYRNPFGDRLRVFEVDHPATQAWKRRRLVEAKIAAPPSLAYVPVDFEREDLVSRLRQAGCDPGRRTFFSWLGVAAYLTRPVIAATLRAVAGLPGGAEIVFDYGEPLANRAPELRAQEALREARVAAVGEPILSRFEPAELDAELRAAGFGEVCDRGLRGLILRCLGPQALERAGSPQDGAGHVVHAATRIA